MMQELTYAFPILSWLVFLPLIGAFIIWVQEDQDLIRKSALGVSGLQLALAMLVFKDFVP